MFPSPRRSIAQGLRPRSPGSGLLVAALSFLAVVAGSGLLCVQAKRAFDVTVLADAPGGGFELHVQPHGLAACASRVLAAAMR